MGITTVVADNWTNYGHSTLASGITNVQTTLPLQTGDGAKFPTSYPFVVAINAAGSAPEICTVTGNATDTLTVTRGAEGTSGNSIAWGSNTTVDLIISAAQMAHIWTVITAINNGALANDGGAIATDGSGDITTSGSYSSNGSTGFQFGNSGHYSQLNGDQGGSIELGSHNSVSPGATQTPYIDFHSSNNARDFDVRLQASGGSATVDGGGTLTITAVETVLSGGYLAFGVGPAAGIASGNTQQGFLYASATVNANVLTAPLNGASDGGIIFTTWHSSAKVNLFSLGGQFGSAPNFIDSGNSLTIAGNLSVGGAGAFTGALNKVGNVGTVGPYGVPIIPADGLNVNVTSSANTNIAQITTPNDGNPHICRVYAEYWVGAGNTNNGSVTLQTVYTDPNAGALTLFFFVYGTTNNVSAFVSAKGSGARCYNRMLVANPNTTVTIQYQNNVAGTISDHCTGVIELLV